jgi:hypothetical protein
MENVQKIEQIDCQNFENALCEARKTTRQKPNQVKVKVGGKLMGVVMEKIRVMITSEPWFHICWV